MKRIIAAFVFISILLIACTKKAVPSGSRRSSEPGEARNKTTQPGDGSPVNTVHPEDLASADTKTASKDNSSTGTKPNELPTGPNAPNKPDAEELGKSIYSSKCNKCHGAKNVKNYNLTQWEGILKSMVPNAKLSTEEENYLLAYIKANAKG